MSKLKPCPFCDCNPCSIEMNTYNLRMDGSFTILSYELHHHCPNTIGSTLFRQYINLKGKTEEQVIEMWNTRA